MSPPSTISSRRGRKPAPHANLHHTLQAVPGQRADGSEQRNQKKFHSITSNGDEQCTSKMETVAKLTGELTRIVPVRAAEGIRIIEQVVRIVQVLRGEAYGESFAEGFREG